MYKGVCHINHFKLVECVHLFCQWATCGCEVWRHHRQSWLWSDCPVPRRRGLPTASVWVLCVSLLSPSMHFLPIPKPTIIRHVRKLQWQAERLKLSEWHVQNWDIHKHTVVVCQLSPTSVPTSFAIVSDSLQTQIFVTNDTLIKI